MKEGIARTRAIPSCMSPSSTRYGVRDAKVVGLNTTSVVLDSLVVKADITYAMSVFLMQEWISCSQAVHSYYKHQRQLRYLLATGEVY